MPAAALSQARRLLSRKALATIGLSTLERNPVSAMESTLLPFRRNRFTHPVAAEG